MTARISITQLPPGLLSAMQQTEHYLATCGCNLRLLELVRLRASQINGCAYCIDTHYQEALAAGEPAQRLEELYEWHDAALYTPQERALLAWTEALTKIERYHISDQLFERMRAFFDESEIANLTLAIGQINTWNRLAKSFGFETDLSY